MRKPTLAPLYPCTLAASVALALLPSLAGAQAQSLVVGASQLEEIVVSAERRTTNNQRTPISISVMSDEALFNRKAISLGSLADGSIPSLRVAPFATRSSALAIGIRGIGASGDANQPARDQGVGVYVDGVFLGRAQGLGTALYDVERIEVLKGPQGTLFGRNTEGGAISIITKMPTGEFSMDTLFGVSNYGGYNSALHMNLPKMGDFSVKVDALQTKRDGTTDNPMRGTGDFNSFNKRGGRISVLWEPSDVFSAFYAADSSYDATTPYYTQVLIAGPQMSALQIAGASLDRRSSSILGGPQEDNVGKTNGHLLTLDWKVADNFELKSISSYRDLTQGQFDQGLIDGISYFTGPNQPFGRYSLAQFDQHQYSQEFQALGHTDEIEYVAGLFYYSESVSDNAQTPFTNLWNSNGTGYTLNPATNPLNLGLVTIDRASHADTDSLGVFGQATWTPAAAQNLHITLGGRYTEDDKSGALFTLNGAPSDLAFDETWSRFDPMVNVAYDVSEDMMVYAKYATGFKAGGANSRSLTYRPFGPEEVTSFELGAKSQFWEDRARLNVAVFQADIKDKQMDFYYPFGVGGSPRTVSDTTNASTKGKSRGAEVEFSIMPVDDLTLGLNYAYTNIDPLEAPNPYAPNLAPTKVLPLYAPKNAGSVSADYVMAVGASNLRFHIDGNWSDGYYTSEIEQTLTDDSFVVNARLALADVQMGQSGAVAEFSLWARNLLDEEHLFYKSASASTGTTFGIFNDPRTFGLDARVRF
jgi:iron complex outermembrane receptor protein